jgi:hypothetical protein
MIIIKNICIFEKTYLTMKSSMIKITPTVMNKSLLADKF